MPALVLWMAGNAVAWALAGSSLYAFDRGGEIIAAILIGMTQGLILSQRTGTPRRWIVVQVLAWLAALLLASRHNIWGAPHPLWLGGVGGVLAGGTQCVLLTRHGDRLLWAATSVVSALLGSWVGIDVGFEAKGLGLGGIAAGALGGCIAGVVLGLASAYTFWRTFRPETSSTGTRRAA
jgi:hypothetical protein